MPPGLELSRLSPDGPPLYMCVNLSARQLQHSDIVSDVRDALAGSGIAPELLTLEITESMLIEEPENAIEKLKRLRALGVRIAMDDFGTGYSSLSYLSRFPVDLIKMDRSFLKEGASPEAADLSSAIVALAARSPSTSSPRASNLTRRCAACAIWAASSARAFTSPSRWSRAACGTFLAGRSKDAGETPAEPVPAPHDGA